jgi:hypothetical protein
LLILKWYVKMAAEPPRERRFGSRSPNPEHVFARTLVRVPRRSRKYTCNGWQEVLNLAETLPASHPKSWESEDIVNIIWSTLPLELEDEKNKDSITPRHPKDKGSIKHVIKLAALTRLKPEWKHELCGHGCEEICTI